MRVKKILLALTTAFVMTSCYTPRNFNYLQDLQAGKSLNIKSDGAIRLQPGDELTVLVKSKDPALAALYNNGMTSKAEHGVIDANTYISKYTMDSDGNIEIPYLGTVCLKDMDRHQSRKHIEQKLRNGSLKDASVTVEFMNMNFTVAGEVNSPGVFDLRKDNTDIFEALGRAGNLSVYGKRDSVLVIRQEGNSKKTYLLDLTKGHEVYNSDAYYIHQHDLIYVKANDVRARQSSQNASELRSFSFWMSLLSVATTLSVLIFK